MKEIEVGGTYRWNGERHGRFRVLWVNDGNVFYSYLLTDGTLGPTLYNRSVRVFCEEATPVYTVEGFEV